MIAQIGQRWLRYSNDKKNICSYIIEITGINKKSVSGVIKNVVIEGDIFPDFFTKIGNKYDFFSIDPYGSSYQKFNRGGKMDNNFIRSGGYWKLLNNQDQCLQ